MEAWKKILEVVRISLQLPRMKFKFASPTHFFLDLSRKNSVEFGESSRESEFVVFKERKLVSTIPVFKGMLRLSFLLETCPPGSVPDAHLLASILDLVIKPFLAI